MACSGVLARAFSRPCRKSPSATRPKPRRPERCSRPSRASRELFLSAHAEPIYEELTEGRTLFRRLDDLVYAAAEFAPGLTPTRPEVAAEAARRQDDKGRSRNRPGHFPRPCSRPPAQRRTPLPRDASAAPRKRRTGPRIRVKGPLDLGAARLARKGTSRPAPKSSIRVFSTRKTMRPCARPRSRSTSRSSIDRARSP